MTETDELQAVSAGVAEYERVDAEVAETEYRGEGNVSVDPVAVDRFADSLVRLLVDWWRHHANEPPDDIRD